MTEQEINNLKIGDICFFVDAVFGIQELFCENPLNGIFKSVTSNIQIYCRLTYSSIYNCLPCDIFFTYRDAIINIVSKKIFLLKELINEIRYFRELINQPKPKK